LLLQDTTTLALFGFCIPFQKRNYCLLSIEDRFLSPISFGIMPRELSSTARAILDQMDSLFENDIERNPNSGTMVTPPRISKANKESLSSPELSHATYRTSSSTITKYDSQGGESAVPSGMVITAEQKFEYAEEAIMDPTWLDSEDDEEDDEVNGDKNKSFISVTGSLLSGLQSDDSKSRSYSFGSSISVGSCGFGKSSLCDLSISSIGSKNSHDNNLLDVIDMGPNYQSPNSFDKSTPGDCVEHELEYLYNLENFSEDEDANTFNQSSLNHDDSSDDEKSLYLPSHLITQKAKKRNQSIEYDVFEKSQGSCGNLDDFSLGDLHEFSTQGKDRNIHAEEENSVTSLDSDFKSGVSKPHGDVYNVDNTKICISIGDKDMNCQSTDSFLNGKECQVIEMENDVCSSRSSCEALSNRSSPSKSEHFDSTILPSEQLLLLNHTAGIVIEDLVFSLFDCLGSKTRKKRNFKSDKSQFKWGHHVFQTCIQRLRNLRMIESSISSDDTVRPHYISPPRAFEDLNLNENINEIECSPQRNERRILDLLACHKFHEAIQQYEAEILRLNQNLDICDARQDLFAKYQRCINIATLNLGIMHLIIFDYESALKALNSALESFPDDNEIHVDVLNLIACANYAMGNFESAQQIWTNALTILNKHEIKNTHVILAQIYNNMGCAVFETLSESKALMYLNKSIAIQSEFIQNPCNQKEHLHRTLLCKLTTTRGNIGYLHIRMKRYSSALRDFETCLRDGNLCLDADDKFVIATLDYLAITFLRLGKDDEALKLYSKILTSKIKEHNGAHDECTVILNKINLLQSKGKKKKNQASQKCIFNICNSIEDNQIEKERFEKLLKSIGLYTRRSHASVR
jgi:tetratricopeptide (TPR) repeat protein